MVDEKIETHGADDEYHFEDFDQLETPEVSEQPHLNSTATMAEPVDAAAPEFGLQQSHRRIIIIGIVLVIILGLLVYRFVNRSLDKLSIPKLETPSLFQSKSATPPPMQMESNAPSVPPSFANQPAPAAIAPTPPPPTVTNAQIDQLNSTIQSQQQTISDLQNSMNGLQETVNNMNGALTAMSGQVSDLMNRLPKPKPPKPVIQAPPPPQVTYTVKAMVPGRAWLQGSNGSTLTVGVGNEVPHMGTVASVDVNSGTVTMGDGTVLTYNTNN